MIGWAPFLLAVWLFAAGLYGVISSRNVIHLIVCLTVIQTATYALLLTIGYRAGGVAPIFTGAFARAPAVDPVVQAMMLTDIVVEATVLALLLALAVQAHKRAGTLDPDRLGLLRD